MMQILVVPRRGAAKLLHQVRELDSSQTLRSSWGNTWSSRTLTVVCQLPCGFWGLTLGAQVACHAPFGHTPISKYRPGLRAPARAHSWSCCVWFVGILRSLLIQLERRSSASLAIVGLHCCAINRNS